MCRLLRNKYKNKIDLTIVLLSVKRLGLSIYSLPLEIFARLALADLLIFLSAVLVASYQCALCLPLQNFIAHADLKFV